MQKQRVLAFYLLVSLFLMQGIFDCGCLYAAPETAGMTMEMPCHAAEGPAEKQQPRHEKDCCGACYLAKFALSPRFLEVSAPEGAFSHFGLTGPVFSGATGFLPTDVFFSSTFSAFAQRQARGVPFSGPDLLASTRLLI